MGGKKFENVDIFLKIYYLRKRRSKEIYGFDAIRRKLMKEPEKCLYFHCRGWQCIRHLSLGPSRDGFNKEKRGGTSADDFISFRPLRKILCEGGRFDVHTDGVFHYFLFSKTIVRQAIILQNSKIYSVLN